MRSVRANDIDIRYELRGAGPTLVLTHGWTNRIEDWLPEVLDGLAEHVRLLVYDVRGHGETTAPEDADAYAMPIYAQDLRGLLDALDIERAHIAGVSQGGMIAAQFAVDVPERTRSLLLCDSSAGNGADEGAGGQWERDMQTFMEVMENVAGDEGLEALGERRIQGSRNRDPHYLDHRIPAEERERQERLRHARMPLHAFQNSCRAMRLRPDLGALIRKLQTPALVLIGEWDDFVPCAERDHRLIDRSRYVVVRRAGHNVSEWRPEAFLSAVTEFVGDVEAGRDVWSSLFQGGN